MFAACAIWGLMAPLGKHAMVNGIGGIEMVTFRVVGGAACFWVASLFVKQEKVRPKDMLLFFFAGMLGIVLNQCCYTIGLSMTSPVNASIMTTMMPIITMILAAIFLREPITSKKVTGVFCGAVGAFIVLPTLTVCAYIKEPPLLSNVTVARFVSFTLMYVPAKFGNVVLLLILSYW